MSEGLWIKKLIEIVVIGYSFILLLIFEII